VATQECIDRHQHESGVWSVAFASNDGTKLVSGGRKGELWWWDRKTGTKSSIPGHRQDATVCCVKASPNFQFFVSGTVWVAGHYEERDNEAIIWDLRGNQPRKLGDPLRGHVVSSIAFSSDSQYFALGRAASTVEIRRLCDQSQVTVLHGEGTWMTGVAFSPDGDYIFTAGASGEIRIFRNWELTENERQVTVFRTEDQLRRVEFFAHGTSFVTGAMDGYIRMWRAEEQTHKEVSIP
jgi:WD40 repeat protein